MQLAGKTGFGLTAKTKEEAKQDKFTARGRSNLLRLNLHFTTLTCFIAYATYIPVAYSLHLYKHSIVNVYLLYAHVLVNHTRVHLHFAHAHTGVSWVNILWFASQPRKTLAVIK